MLQRCLDATDAGRLLKQIKEQEKAERAERAEHKRHVDMRRRELHETQKKLELQAQKLWQDQQNKLRLMMQAVNHEGRVARNVADCAGDSTSAGSGAACSGATCSSNSPNVLTELEVAVIQEHHVHEGMELRQQILEASREEAQLKIPSWQEQVLELQQKQLLLIERLEQQQLREPAPKQQQDPSSGEADQVGVFLSGASSSSSLELGRGEEQPLDQTLVFPASASRSSSVELGRAEQSTGVSVSDDKLLRQDEKTTHEGEQKHKDSPETQKVNGDKAEEMPQAKKKRSFRGGWQAKLREDLLRMVAGQPARWYADGVLSNGQPWQSQQWQTEPWQSHVSDDQQWREKQCQKQKRQSILS